MIDNIVSKCFIRIYTCLGKENVRTLRAFSTITEQYNSDAESQYILELHDDREELVTEVIRIVETGQPCNIHIRCINDEIATECILNCCTVCERTNRILLDEYPDIKITRNNLRHE